MFEGPDVVAREYLLSDDEGFTALVADPRAMAPLGGPSPDPARLFARVLESNEPDERAWAVIHRSSRRYVGHVFISRTTLVPELELGFVFSPSCWGQGFARQAVTGLVGVLRSRAPGMRLAATVNSDNLAAQLVLRAAGFSLRGIQHDDQGPYLVFTRTLVPPPAFPLVDAVCVGGEEDIDVVLR